MTLHVRDLAFGYVGHPVGRELSFEVAPGQVVALLGPNGSGKTTLFRTLLGLLPAQGGEVRVGELSVAGLGAAERARLMAYVPQAFEGYFPYTVRETVLMGRTAHLGTFAVPSQRDRDEVTRVLETLGIGALAERPYTAVSGGERQLTLIARALVQRPRIVVLDEPTASLDFGNASRVLALIRKLADDGLAVVLSSHDPSHSFLVADRVVLLQEGRAVCQGSPAEVVTAETMRSVYGVEVEVHELPGAAGRPLRVCLPKQPG